MRIYTGIGMMAGTSMDGLDIAACRFRVYEDDTYDFELLAQRSLAYDETWRTRLLCLNEQTAEVYAKTHVYYGHWLGKQVQQFIAQEQLSVDFVASHGQTIFHQPDKTFTAQIGDGESLVSYLDCPLVTNFRNKDIACGGEGAPLIAIGEKYLFPEADLFLNLGGFSNITYNSLAFDVVPCNIVLNYLARICDEQLRFDPQGEIAASGQLIPQLLDTLNELPYYKQAPPKTLGWEWVQQHVFPLIRSDEYTLPDFMHTYCAHVAYQIARAISVCKIPPQALWITGGGRYNVFLMELLGQALSPLSITIAPLSEELIDYKEAIVFAFLGLRVLTGKSSSLSSATGAKYDVLAGSVHLAPHGGWDLLKHR